MRENSLAKHTHIQRRGAIYYFRMRVPGDLKEHFGKSEFFFSLKTKDKEEANRKGSIEFLKLDKEIAAARHLLAPSPAARFLTRADIPALAQGFADDILSDDETQRLHGDVPDEYTLGIDVLEDNARRTFAGVSGPYRRWMFKLVRQEIAALNLNVPLESDLEAELVTAYARAAAGAIDVIRKRESGRVLHQPLRSTHSPHVVKADATLHAQVTLSVVIGKYIAEQELADNWHGKTSSENRSIFDTLVWIVGDLPMNELGYAQMDSFVDILKRLPANAHKSPKYRGKSLAELLELNEAPISTTTLNKYITRISSLFGWAKRKRYLTENFAQGLTVVQRGRKASDSRDMFEQNHLDAIFKAISEGRVTASGRKQSFHYWAPLLGYFTGGRVNEIASLRLSDFQQDAGIDFVSINQQNDGEKGTKTTAGTREIPLHPALIELGLLRHISTLRAKGETKLFPELTLSKNGYGSKVTSWFSGHNAKADGFLWRQAGIHEEKLSFHSYRHTMATLLEQHGINEVLTKRIMGHSLNKDVTYGRYAKARVLPLMLEAIKTAIPQTPISHLRKFESWLL